MRNFTINGKLIVADFETVVYDGQTETEVWSAAYAGLFSDEIGLFSSIDDFLIHLFRLKENVTGWFHNLKFDGNFIISWLLRNKYEFRNIPTYEMAPKTFKCLISSKNRFYSLTIKTPQNKVIEFRDSAKLIPYSLKKAGEAFETEHQKLEMEYKGKRYAGWKCTPEEKAYIINDVLVLKEILEKLIDRDMTRLTIGSVCMHEYKQSFDKFEWGSYFPDLRNTPCEPEPDLNAEQYIRKTYRGAWCYLKRAGQYKNGSTYDANSLYPSQMHSKSGNYYPVGQPHWFTDKIPDICNRKDIVYFIHVKCRFELKSGYLPTIQIKNNFLYKSTEWLKTSKIKYRGKYYDYLVDKDGNKHYSDVDLYLTFKDYELLLKHYDVYDLHIISGCWFTGMLGLFDDYIDKWFNLKANAPNKTERNIVKLYLNNLYGKFATSDDATYLKPYLDKNGVVCYEPIISNDKDVLYIPVGSMVTSYARFETITNAQLNYDVFLYADTDSLHIEGTEVKGIRIHESDLLAWKCECKWDEAKFIRQKTYAEKYGGEWHITCAGMPDRSKKLFLETHDISEFDYGLSIGGKLVPKLIKGGVILEERYFTLKK